MLAPPRPIGFYVHYHGRGHRNRTLAILEELKGGGRPAVILASRMEGLDWPGNVDQVVELACDIDGVPKAGRERAEDSPALHFAPLHVPTIRRRVAQIARWIDDRNPAAIVVDVSVEVAMLARLASVPTLLMRQHGDRRDSAHEIAYRGAARLLAPFPESMEDDLTPDWVREKTTYSGAFCRYAGPAPTQSAARAGLGWDERPRVVVMSGRGGDGSNLRAIREAAAQMPETTWIVVGLVDGDETAALPPNVEAAGWIDDPLRYLAAADAVVSAGGHNSVMELAHARSRAIVIPEPRPFGEQVRKAAILRREGLAVVRESWPSPDQWADTIAEAQSLDPSRWDRIADGSGAAPLAEAIERVAAESESVAMSAAVGAFG